MNIRNFSIIAHVDHGKSTLADRLLEITGTIAKEKMQPQLLDSLALERERGITIKLAPVRLNYTLHTIPYTLNLIDTPGHVDFSYEVSRALAAVEGAVLLVDATKGIQAQTLAHGLAALEQNLTLIPVINKIDMPNADIEGTKKQLIDTYGFSEEEILLVSGKTGQGVDKLLEEIVIKIPGPKQEIEKPLRALIFDSFFDSFKGVIAQVRIVEGQTPKDQSQITFLGTKSYGHVLETGFFAPQLTLNNGLKSGDIGYIATGIKEPDLVRVGDTISTSFEADQLPGYKLVKPMVFVGLFPIDSADYFDLKEALSKFRLNDPAFKDIKEPWVTLKIFVPQTYIGPVMELVQDKRGKFINMQHFGIQVEMSYEMPLAEMVTNFYDKLKSVSSGFASLDWEFLDFREADCVRVDFLVGGEKGDALSTIVFRPKAEGLGRRMVEKLKEVLPRQNFTVAIQAAIGGTIIARESISPFRKDVTAKLYGGDVTRKNKLLDKQKKGKKKMKM